MNSSESIANLSKALSEFQSEITNPANTATNPFFKSKYAPLSEILTLVRPILGKYGLSIVQNPSTHDGDVIIKTTLLHASGEFIESDPLTLKMEKVTAQGAGSAITYARRYAISAILGLASEDDDDGNAATKDGNNKKSKPNKDLDILDNKKKEIGVLVNELKNTNKEKTLAVLYEYIKKADGTPTNNYIGIQSVDIADKVLKALKSLKNELKI